jgi:hypothetical protein
MRDPAMKQIHFEWLEELSLSDSEAIIALLNEVAESTGTNGYDRRLSDQESSKLCAHLSNGLYSGSTEQLIARSEDTQQVVGIATLEVPSQATRKHIIEIKRVVIASSARGVFLLSAWKEILNRCEATGRVLVCIDVSEDGPHELWRRLGFKDYAKVKDYARTGGRKLDGYYMSVYVDEARDHLSAFKVRGNVISV